MLFGLMKSERERAAEHDAAILRAHYGEEAEAFCECALTGQERPEAGRSIQLILRALKHTQAKQGRHFSADAGSTQLLSIGSQAVQRALAVVIEACENFVEIGHDGSGANFQAT